MLALTTSFYLFSSTFGIKDSPAFQEIRDKVAAIYVLSIDDELNELEKEIEKEVAENNQ